MKTIAQIVLSLILSFGVTAGLNGSVRSKAEQTLQRVEGIVAQAADFGMQTASNATANASAQTSANAGASASSHSHSSVSSSASASGNAGGGANLGAALKNLLKGNGQTNAGANANANTQTSVNATGSSLFLNLLFGGQSDSNAGVSLGH